MSGKVKIEIEVEKDQVNNFYDAFGKLLSDRNLPLAGQNLLIEQLQVILGFNPEDFLTILIDVHSMIKLATENLEQVKHFLKESQKKSSAYQEFAKIIHSENSTMMKDLLFLLWIRRTLMLGIFHSDFQMKLNFALTFPLVKENYLKDDFYDLDNDRLDLNLHNIQKFECLFNEPKTKLEFTQELDFYVLRILRILGHDFSRKPVHSLSILTGSICTAMGLLMNEERYMEEEKSSTYRQYLKYSIESSIKRISNEMT